ncbi:hypothetical protein GQ53DRAFT_743241 [Thozetella sp. PMI_491]|nr:hypothetical protein GQ53DRAFT_743241 [Thozetella sp. PMI_491]
MAVDIEELVIAPFREVVERGKEALANAEAAVDDNEDAAKAMEKAAKAVVREGERALKRLQPLWDSQVEKYGDTFKTTMSKNEDIEDKRRKLEDLLYDFEDYVEIDTFEEERFTELQAAAKSLALDLLDIIKRLRIDGVPISPPAKQPLFPPLPPLPPLPPHALAAIKQPIRSPTNPSPPRPGSSGKRDSVLIADARLRVPKAPGNATWNKATEAQRPMHHNLARSDTKASRGSSVTSVDPLPPYSSQDLPTPIPDMPRPLFTPAGSARPGSRPQPPTVDTDLGRSTSVRRPESRMSTTSNAISADGSQPRAAAEPSSPASTERSVFDIPTFPLPTRTTAWVHDQSAGIAPPRPVRPIPPQGQALQSREAAIPENAVLVSSPHTEMINFEHPMSPVLSKLKRFSVEASMGARVTAMLDSPHDSTPATTPATSASNNGFSQTSSISSTSPSTGVAPQKNDGLGVSDRTERSSSLAKTDLNVTSVSLPSGAEFEEGLMVAEDWTTVVSDGGSLANGKRALSTVSSRDADCSVGPKSSLYQMKGFCNGAQAFKKGSHWDGVKKTSGYVAGNTTHIGRCIECGYAHQYDELSLDMDRNPKASFNQGGLRFRVRFLYKSHLAATKMTEAYYGCVFCAQTGSTVREGDATVFTSSDMLLRHLMRHPQPLPDVPGITVLYGKDLPADDLRLNNFDVHFVEPPITSSGLPASVINDIARLPVVTGVKTHVQKWGEKKLQRPDGIGEKEMLQFFVGARIIGVEMHGQWQGKWASGWHDGQWGVFPIKSVEFEKPRRNEIPPILQAGSVGPVGTSVTARWKFDPKDAADKGWLVFDKGETIKNVGWIYKEHWCWSGTNSKGKVGVFPRPYVMYDAVKEEAIRPGSIKSKKTPSRPRLFGRSRTTSSSAASSVVEIVL